MGYDLNRFMEQVDEEIICPICKGVLEDALQVPSCEHAFCRSCITESLAVQPICPIDRQTITESQLKQVPRIYRNLLSRLNITCSNKSYGCEMLVKLEVLADHLSECKYDPKKPVPCEGCGYDIPRDELEDHNCLKKLKGIVQENEKQIDELQSKIIQQQFDIYELRQVQKFETNEVIRKILMLQYNERRNKKWMHLCNVVIKWSNTLPIARVMRWDRMICRPEGVLLTSLGEALTKSGCPDDLYVALAFGSHEHYWPPGLSSLESRQNNQRYYENYICRRIPGAPAVVVLYVDNVFQQEDMISNPGFVITFADYYP